ncbi:hypothetical protein SK128_025110, partial [Halocaridina rubra]
MAAQLAEKCYDGIEYTVQEEVRKDFDEKGKQWIDQGIIKPPGEEMKSKVLPFQQANDR